MCALFGKPPVPPSTGKRPSQTKFERVDDRPPLEVKSCVAQEGLVVGGIGWLGVKRDMAAGASLSPLSPPLTTPAVLGFCTCMLCRSQVRGQSADHVCAVCVEMEGQPDPQTHPPLLLLPASALEPCSHTAGPAAAEGAGRGGRGGVMGPHKGARTHTWLCACRGSHRVSCAWVVLAPDRCHYTPGAQNLGVEGQCQGLGVSLGVSLGQSPALGTRCSASGPPSLVR